MGNVGEEDQHEVSRKCDKLSVMKEGKSNRAQVKSCYICGDSGFTDLLIGCRTCLDSTAHKYCLGIVPGSSEDVDGYDWACEFCPPLVRSELDVPQISGSLMIECESEIILFEDEPTPLCTVSDQGCSEQAEQINHSESVDQARMAAPLSVDEPLEVMEESEAQGLWHKPVKSESGLVSPVSTSWEMTDCRGMRSIDNSHCHIAGGTQIFTSKFVNHSVNHTDEPEAPVSSFMESPKAIMSGLVLLVSPSGEVIVRSDMSSCDDLHSPEASVSSFMESPKELMSGLVLVATQSGEIVIRTDTSFNDFLYSHSWSTSMFDTASSPGEVNLYQTATKLRPCKVEAEWYPTENERVAASDDMFYLRQCEGTRRVRRKISDPCKVEAEWASTVNETIAASDDMLYLRQCEETRRVRPKISDPCY